MSHVLAFALALAAAPRQAPPPPQAPPAWRVVALPPVLLAAPRHPQPSLILHPQPMHAWQPYPPVRSTPLIPAWPGTPANLVPRAYCPGGT